MRKISSALILLLFSGAPALATWSVIAVDGQTGQVAIASATCVAQARFANFPAKGLMDIQAVVVPGKAVAAAQASVDHSRKNQQLIFSELQKGTPPAEIIRLLKQDPQIERRQFGIVDLQGRIAGYSGSENRDVSLDVQGQVPGHSIFYSIQGNILASEEVVRAAAAAFEKAGGALTDRVMAAMEAADHRGGDRRCTCETEPLPPAPCEGKTAHVAYLLRADPTDSNVSSYNDGDYAMYISVTDQDIRPDENANPVKTLRTRYEAWKRDHATESKSVASHRRR